MPSSSPLPTYRQAVALPLSASAVESRPSGRRPVVHGKFVEWDDRRQLVRGVTYGPFCPDAAGEEYHSPEIVARDFSMMSRAGVNAVRTYTVPPRWLLDLADEHRLKLMIGIPWEQHVAFLDSRAVARRIERRVSQAVESLAGHPAILCYAIGNEIPSSVARWHGGAPLSHFLERLWRACRREDPLGLVTYANYPSTEYVSLPFLDFISFNVYLETQQKLEAYIARLHNIAGDRPLVISELGLDALRNGADQQARVIDWQVRSTFASGCAGTFVFSWTDEWFRGGQEITDWQFGLTSREREPRIALGRLASSFNEIPFPPQIEWPLVSVVVCTYNGSRTLRDALGRIARLNYPNFETIVVDDGSTDESAQIAREFDVRLIQTTNRGLSAARNTGCKAARGEIVAYLDDDAYPDPYWLQFIASGFMQSDHVGIGGPNIPPPDDGLRADCVAHAPGGPMHVLITDTVAEHLPGCNMAFRKSALEAIGGFDEQFCVAGDDVDVCWRLQARGWTLGFVPGAMVWHHRRGTLLSYWKQQKNYGRAEAILERKWPEKYNALGHATWTGRLYGKGLLWSIASTRHRIYHGSWGSALFQSVYNTGPGGLASLPATPEWYLMILTLGALAGWGIVWTPLLWFAPLLGLLVAINLVQSAFAAKSAFPGPWFARSLLIRRFVTMMLHLAQPVARLIGRLGSGLTPWRRRGVAAFSLPYPRRRQLWVQQWRAPETELVAIETSLRSAEAVVLRGGDFDNWDLEVRGGLFGSVRLRTMVEEHGDGKQMFRLRCWPVVARAPAFLLLLLILVWDAAAFAGEWITWAVVGAFVLALGSLLLRELGLAMAAVLHATAGWNRERGRR